MGSVIRPISSSILNGDGPFDSSFSIIETKNERIPAEGPANQYGGWTCGGELQIAFINIPR